MISRGSLRITSRRRTKLGRVPLHVEVLEARCLLAADVAVAPEVSVPTDLELPYPEGTAECFMSGEFMIATCGFSELTPPIDPQAEMGDVFDVTVDMIAEVETFVEPAEVIDAGEAGVVEFSELMFFSMAMDGEGSLPADDAATCDGILIDESITVGNEVVDLAAETVIDPMIFASFSGSNDDVSGPEVDATVGGSASFIEAHEMLPSPDAVETQAPSPELTTLPPATPTAQAYDTFGKTPSAFAASLAAAFAGFGGDRSGSGDDGFIGDRRRGRR